MNGVFLLMESALVCLNLSPFLQACFGAADFHSLLLKSNLAALVVVDELLSSFLVDEAVQFDEVFL